MGAEEGTCVVSHLHSIRSLTAVAGSLTAWQTPQHELLKMVVYGVIRCFFY